MDDENSQAESNFEPAVQLAALENVQNVQNINHYENVDAVQVQALGGPAPLQNDQPAINQAQIVNLQNRANVQAYHQPYRNDVYDRTGGYDVPRNVRNNNMYANQRRSNLHLDFNRPRCPSVNHQKYQRSFDDTESCYYGSSQGYNANSMYERVREEPLYQNSGNGSVYGRLDVLGHGIGRIERHLSSSCGNIDHYNVGGHYAVLSHAHAGQMLMNSATGQTGAGPSVPNALDGVKSFFSCLGGESSQSMSNINGPDGTVPSNQSVNPPAANVAQRQTGAIPKTKNKQNNKVSPKPLAPAPCVPVPPPMPNRISKSSLQYLLSAHHKWLPLGPNYKIIDFNFTGQCDNGDGVVQFNGQAEMYEPRMFNSRNAEYPTMNGHQRVIRNTPQLGRLRESDAENALYENTQRDGFRGRMDAFRARSESPSRSGTRQRNEHDDPFRPSWSFNFENNTFRPAGPREVKRITDGTFAVKDFQEQNPKKEVPDIIVDNDEPQQPSTSKSTSPSCSEVSNTATSSSSTTVKTSEMKKSENYENLASLQQDEPANGIRQRKKKSTESQSSDSVTLAEEDEDADNDDPFEDLESDDD